MMEICPAVNYHGFWGAMRGLGSKRIVERKMASATRRQVTDISTRLRWFYELGREVVAADNANKNKVTYSLGVVKKYAAKTGLSRDSIHKARQFAKTYTKREFAKLAAARTSNGIPLGFAHVVLLLQIQDDALRKEIQSQTIEQGWSFEQLRKVVKAHSVRKSRGGRRPTRPPTAEAALLQIEEMSNAWIRWHENLQELSGEDADRSGITLADLPKKVTELLASTIQPIKTLGDRAHKDLESSKAKAKQGQSGKSVSSRTRKSRPSKRRRARRGSGKV